MPRRRPAVNGGNGRAAEHLGGVRRGERAGDPTSAASITMATSARDRHPLGGGGGQPRRSRWRAAPERRRCRWRAAAHEQREKREAARRRRQEGVLPVGDPRHQRVRSLTPEKESIMWMAAGPMTAMKRQGRMQKISGIGHLDRHLLGLLLRPLTTLDAHLRGLHAQHVRDRDAEGVRLHHRADEATAARRRCVRSASARSASARPEPICISRSTRENSSASGPSVLWATCCNAASKPRPDSTQMVSRSMASGSSRWMRFERS